MSRPAGKCSGIVLEVAGATDAGAARRSNQDRILGRAAGENGAHADRALLGVADGVGGAPSGERASTIAIETLDQGFDRLLDGDPKELLSELFATANQRVLEGGNRTRQDRGMACTLVAAAIRGGDVWLANIGDSRAYLRQGGSLRQVTNDHSLAADASLEPRLRKLAAAKPGAQNVLTRSLGSPSGVSPDIFGPIRVEIGDCLLLCSDGLYNLVSVEELSEALDVSEHQVDHITRRLVALANELGAPDNVSVVVLRAVACLRHYAEGSTR